MYFDFDPRAQGMAPMGGSYPEELRMPRVQAANGVDWETCFDIVLEDVAPISLEVP